MSQHVVLLRGVSAAGGRQVAAEDIGALLVELGFANVRPGPKAGDLVLASPDLTGPDLQARIETALLERFSLRTDVHARTASAWRAMVAANPYTEFAANDPGWTTVFFLKDTPDKKAVGALRAALRGRDQLRAESRQVYAIQPDGPRGSTLTSALVEKTLGARVTGRPWTAVLALEALLDD